MYCKRCTGKLYEDEIWYDSNGVKQQEISCYQCPAKIQVEHHEWLKLKRKIESAMIKTYAKNKVAKK
jgi:hypothetical protein